MNLSFIALGITILISRNIFRTILSRIVMVASLVGAMAILQYWLQSKYIVYPILISLILFFLLGYRYIVDKPTGVSFFGFVISIYLLFVILNPRQFHNLFRPTFYEDYVLTQYRQDQGLLADRLINKYKVINKEKADKYFEEALKEEALNHTEEALANYDRSIQNNPDNARVYHRRGVLKMTKLDLNPGNILSALKDYSRAIRLDSSLSEAYHHRAMAFYFLGYKNRAFLDQLKVLQLDSLMPDDQFERKYGRSKKSLTIPPDS